MGNNTISDHEDHDLRSATKYTIRTLVEMATKAASSVAVDTAEAGRGLCLVTSAILGRSLIDRGIDVQVAVGSFTGQPHWWLVWDDLIVDATRMQFDGGDLISDDNHLYEPERVIQVLWTDEQLIQEAERVFFPYEATAFVSNVQNAIDDELASQMENHGKESTSRP